MTRPPAISLLPLLLPTLYAFTPNHNSPRTTTKLHYQTFDTNGGGASTAKPAWVPMELIEILASDCEIPLGEFVTRYVDGEAYTSCDDEGDELHECDFFGQYLGTCLFLLIRLELAVVVSVIVCV
jgi:hypothetical protein